MESCTRRALKVRVFHNGNRSTRRPLSWLVGGHDGSQGFPPEIQSQVEDVSQQQDTIVFGYVKILSLLLLPVIGGHGGRQEVGKTGVVERPQREAGSVRHLELCSDV